VKRALVASVAAIVVTLTLAACSDDGDAGEASPTPTTGPATSVPIGAGAAASCVETYSSGALAGRAFAFDGTVTNIGTVENLLYVEVTFEVNEWFKGDGPPEVIVEMFPPAGAASATTSAVTSAGSADYAVGSRLLVAGEPRWGGAPLEDPIAWYCGFTRTYDDTTASDWRAALP
jgi:hypothetical protein